MQSASEAATSVVMDLFLAARIPWTSGELYFQPEVAGGRGLSSTLGVAAFPSGEVYRVGNPEPTVVVGRAYYRQVFGFGGGRAKVDGAANQLGGERDRDALTITLGKFGVPDVFDSVPQSSDPHTRFMSWGLFASAAYDYPADTRGYTWGAAADFSRGRWSLRAGIFAEPKVANGIKLEPDPTVARGLVAEVERRFSCGAVRALAFLNTADMGSYAQATAAQEDISLTRAQGRTKAGAAASANCDFGNGLGGFVRGSFNDGKNETWAFTEIDRSLALGAIQSGARWSRPNDEAGIAVVVSGLSGEHRAYLESGQFGFLIGDGALDYAPEVLGELYYRFGLDEHVSIGVNYQPIFNPAYNHARGPVNVFTARAHVAF
ncbi:MAG TPA: carbohydrate porin [Myxococcales bacterium]|nr:carbohydrate porin [Myxococcales bacterium]